MRHCAHRSWTGLQGGEGLTKPYEDLARQIEEAAHQVTDAQVSAVRDVTGSDRAAFEIIMSACVGSGVARWDAAVQAMTEADDAAS